MTDRLQQMAFASVCVATDGDDGYNTNLLAGRLKSCRSIGIPATMKIIKTGVVSKLDPQHQL
jgi:ribosomal protein S19E (S16A)